MSIEISNSDDMPVLERNGPKYGISFTRAQADILIRQHLNMSITSWECIDRGYNNLIFLIQTAESEQGYALKIGGRYWNKIKTEAEVKALEMVTKYTSIPAPKVLAYSSDRNNEFGVEWILMTRLPGTDLGSIYESPGLSFIAKKSIIRDLADYVAQMHFKVPCFNQIGAFNSNGEISTDLNRLGPWSTYEQFIRDRVHADEIVLKENSIFEPVRESVLDAIQQFNQLKFPDLKNLPFVFSHGDMDPHNMLVTMDDPEAPRITGIVDWEWAGSFPCSEEYFTSYKYFLEDDDAVRTYLYDEFEKRNILTPRTIERFSLLNNFNRFATNIALWDLTDLLMPDDPMVSTKLQKSHSSLQTAIQELKEELK